MKTTRTIHVNGTPVVQKQEKRILVLAANPKDTTWLRLDEEMNEIEKALESAKLRELFRLEKKLAVTNRDIQHAMLKYEPHIVHFTGHGSQSGIILEGDMGTSTLASGEALAMLFEIFKDKLECVILSACYSEPQARAINRHIDYVVGMNNAILERSSIEFATAFFQALGFGRSYEEAYKLGRAAILQHFPEHSEHDIPVLLKKIEEAPIGPATETVQIRFRIESTQEIFDFDLRLNANTAAEKNRLIDLLELPHTTDKNEAILFYLFSFTQEKILDDSATIKENGIVSGEELSFMIEIDD